MKKKLALVLLFAGIIALVVNIEISCSKKDNFVPQLSLKVTSLSVAAAAYSTDTFIITSNTAWTTSSSQSWLIVSPTSGSNNGTVTIIAQQNTDTLARTATITVSAKGTTSQTIKVTQSGAVYNISISTTSLSVAAATNSTGTFTVTSNTGWTVLSSQSWLTVSPASGSNNGTVTVTAQQNTDTAARKATVTVSIKGKIPQNITVTQSGTIYNLSVSTTLVNVATAANSTGTFAITSNTSWTVSSSPNWLTVSPASGSNNGIVTVTAQQITVGVARQAGLHVSASYNPTQTVYVRQNGIPCLSSDENFCDVSGCSTPVMPSSASLTTNSHLPDPFTFMNGSRVTSKTDWTCRRAEIADLAQEFEYGHEPCTPYSATTGSISGNTITVTVTNNGKTISFDCLITYPSSGSAPYPAMIGVGGSFLNNSQLSSQGVAVINFPNDLIAQENNTASRGVGLFFDFFCSSHSAGAIIAWAWGMSRLIDAIEKTPAANIDPTRLGVTGCSRYGKGALACGAFDQRIVLTIPQESGSGGSASWRVSDYELYQQGEDTQTLNEINGEDPWFRANFTQFANSATKLPFDHHSIIGLIAPRACLIIENNILWLGP